jgi:hypothetical protein
MKPQEFLSAISMDEPLSDAMNGFAKIISVDFCIWMLKNNTFKVRDQSSIELLFDEYKRKNP